MSPPKHGVPAAVVGQHLSSGAGSAALAWPLPAHALAGAEGEVTG